MGKNQKKQKKRISLYVKSGNNAATVYYRFVQYLQNIDCQVCFRKQLTDRQYKVYMPLSEQPLFIKGFFYLIIVTKFWGYLAWDFLFPPDSLIISRNLVKPVMPYSFRFLLAGIKKRGSQIIWDFDDDILELKELRKPEFGFLSGLADKIIIASNDLRNIIDPTFYEKIIFLPTTDGEMINLVTENVKEMRAKKYEEETRLLWVGASGSLGFVMQITNKIEDAAIQLNTKGKHLILTIVCDKPLEYKPSNFTINNIKWTREAAQKAFLDSHIGLMPLPINKQTKGKGGFKLIQYLSVGLPSVASSVGINSIILSKGAGYAIDNINSEEWVRAIFVLGSNYEKWIECSKKAEQTYREDYDYVSNLRVWNKLLVDYE